MSTTTIPNHKLGTIVDQQTPNGGDTTELSRWLRERRLSLNLKSSEISRQLGYHDSWWGLHEIAHGSAKFNRITGKRGPFVPTIRTIQMVAPILNVSYSNLAKICGRPIGEPTGFQGLEIKQLRERIDDLESELIALTAKKSCDHEDLVKAVKTIMDYFQDT